MQPPVQYLPERDAARYLRKSLSTLRRWRWMRTGPAWTKCGKAVEYLLSDLDAFRASGRVEPVRGAR